MFKSMTVGYVSMIECCASDELEHTVCFISLALSPTASFAAPARVPADALSSLAMSVEMDQPWMVF